MDGRVLSVAAAVTVRGNGNSVQRIQSQTKSSINIQPKYFNYVYSSMQMSADKNIKAAFQSSLICYRHLYTSFSPTHVNILWLGMFTILQCGKENTLHSKNITIQNFQVSKIFFLISTFFHINAFNTNIYNVIKEYHFK